MARAEEKATIVIGFDSFFYSVGLPAFFLSTSDGRAYGEDGRPQDGSRSPRMRCATWQAAARARGGLARKILRSRYVQETTE